MKARFRKFNFAPFRKFNFRVLNLIINNPNASNLLIYKFYIKITLRLTTKFGHSNHLLYPTFKKPKKKEKTKI